MRRRNQLLKQGLGRDHLSRVGMISPFELPRPASWVTRQWRRRASPASAHPGPRNDRAPQFDGRLTVRTCEPPDGPRRLELRVVRMEEHARKASGRAGSGNASRHFGLEGPSSRSASYSAQSSSRSSSAAVAGLPVQAEHVAAELAHPGRRTPRSTGSCSAACSSPARSRAHSGIPITPPAERRTRPWQPLAPEAILARLVQAGMEAPLSERRGRSSPP